MAYFYNYSFFALTPAEDVAELSLQVGGVDQTGYHLNNDGTRGHMAGASAIVQCEKAEKVFVICMRSGTSISPNYGRNQFTAAFSGVLLEIQE